MACVVQYCVFVSVTLMMLLLVVVLVCSVDDVLLCVLPHIFVISLTVDIVEMLCVVYIVVWC